MMFLKILFSSLNIKRCNLFAFVKSAETRCDFSWTGDCTWCENVNYAFFHFFKLKALNKYVNYNKFNRLGLYFGYLKTRNYSESSLCYLA